MITSLDIMDHCQLFAQRILCNAQIRSVENRVLRKAWFLPVFEFGFHPFLFFLREGASKLSIWVTLFVSGHLLRKRATLNTGLSYVIMFDIKTAVSVRLYPFKYKFKRAYMSIGIFAIVAALNSFIERPSVGVLSGLMGLTLVILLYQDVFKRLVRDVFEVWDLVAKKYR